MTTIYIVTSGSYSDYSINAVCLDKEIAENYATAVNSLSAFSDAGVEEWDIATEVPAIGTVYFVSIEWTPHLDRTTTREWDYSGFNVISSDGVTDRRNEWSKPPDEKFTHSVQANSLDKAKALKMASDRMAEIKYRYSEENAEEDS